MAASTTDGSVIDLFDLTRGASNNNDNENNIHSNNSDNSKYIILVVLITHSEITIITWNDNDSNI